MNRNHSKEMANSQGKKQGSGKAGRRGRVGAGILVALVIVLIGGAVAAWAYDDARGDQIAAGVTIGGVDVGGLEADQARQLLNRKLVEPLRKPLKIRYEGETWQLAPEAIKPRMGLAAAVDQAVEISRDTGLPARIWRYVTGGSVDKAITPRVKYSKPAVNDFVREVAGAINKDPVDAGVNATGSTVEVVEASNGVKLRDRLLTRQVRSAILDPVAPRTFAARTMAVEPEVSTAEAAEKYPVYLTLNRSTFELKLWKDLKLAKTYTVAVGAIGMDTPAGLYNIQNKAVDPAWHVPNSDWAGDLAGQVIPGGTPENPLKARWLGIYDGAGIHGTAEDGSLGSAASHGCVRMAVPDVIELYDQVPVGTPIYIA